MTKRIPATLVCEFFPARSRRMSSVKKTIHQKYQITENNAINNFVIITKLVMERHTNYILQVFDQHI